MPGALIPRITKANICGQSSTFNASQWPGMARPTTTLLNTTASQAMFNQPNLPAPTVRLSIKVSTNEEHTRLAVFFRDASIDLGEREHHYLLATLARKRLADAKDVIDETAQGWIETKTLARTMGIGSEHLNIQIFRLRQQMQKMLPDCKELHQLIERRRGELRLSNLAFEIYRGSKREGQYVPNAGKHFLNQLNPTS